MYTATSAKELHQCRGSNENQDFISWHCPRDQVIHIQSAVVGRRKFVSCELNSHFPTCVKPVTNRLAVLNCNGKSTCQIQKGILDFYRPDQLCDRYQNGNFINITYDCVNLGKKRYRFMDFAPKIFYCLHYV